MPRAVRRYVGRVFFFLFLPLLRPDDATIPMRDRDGN